LTVGAPLLALPRVLTPQHGIAFQSPWAIVRRCLRTSGGREVKHTGDGIMSSFASTPETINCAVAIQQGFARYNRGNAEPIHVWIGLDCGEPVEDSNDLFGSKVQLAASLCSAASPDLVSENIHREHGSAADFKPTKRRRLKGFSHPVSTFECAWSAPSPKRRS
jgi:class 3 adenylate cyclase